MAYHRIEITFDEIKNSTLFDMLKPGEGIELAVIPKGARLIKCEPEFERHRYVIEYEDADGVPCTIQVGTAD